MLTFSRIKDTVDVKLYEERIKAPRETWISRRSRRDLAHQA